MELSPLCLFLIVYLNAFHLIKALWKAAFSGKIQIYWNTSAAAAAYQPPEMDVLSFQTNSSLDPH